MPRYMIEHVHDPDPKACLRALEMFMRAGSHYLTNADWGCLVDDHRAWITVEAEDDGHAYAMCPPVIRHSATITRLNKFTPQEIRDLVAKRDRV